MQEMRRALFVLAVAGLASGCYEQAFVPGDEGDGRIQITNDEFLLDQRVGYPDTDVLIDSVLPLTSAPGGPSLSGPLLGHRPPSQISLKLKAEASPPTVGGVILQATSVWLRGGNKAIVSYNVRGATALGALDFFEKLDKKNPKLKSSATFSDMDVNAVSMDGDFAYAAMASSDITRPFPAVVERLRFKKNKFTLDGNLDAQLVSFAATSSMSTGSTIYVTSGDGGSVYALEPNSLAILGEYPLDDARWVAWDEDGGRVVVAQGTPGRLSVFAEGDFPGGSMTLLNTFSFPGADIAESKTTVEIHGGRAFVAAGPAGVQVICLDDGQIVGTVPIPDPAALGLDPSVVVTNAVTVEDDIMFISNGEAGVYAALGADSFEEGACGDPLTITVLGQLRFDDLESVNHVVISKKRLFIAAGLGGIKIVEVKVK